MKNWIDNLGYFGLAAFLVGGLYYSITQVWDWRTQSAVYGGAALLVLYVVGNAGRIWAFLNSRTGKQGMTAGATLLLGVGILGFINFLSVRHHQRVDLTEDQLNALSEQTRKVVGGLGSDIEVVGFYTDEAESSGFQTLLREYTFISPRVSYQVLDPEKDPGRAQEYEATPTQRVFVSRGERREPLDTFSEEKITNAIIKVTRDTEKTVYFLQGHGERDLSDPSATGYSVAKSEIEKQNYQVEAWILGQQGALPAGASAVVSAGPQVNFLPGEEELLRAYLDKGGKFFLLLDPDSNFSMPEFLADYGVAVSDQIVIDASLQSQLMGAGAATPLVVGYDSTHPITKDLQVMSFFPMANSVAAADRDHGFSVTELARTSNSSWGESALEGDTVSFDEGVDTPGPLALGVVATKSVKPAEPPAQDSGSEGSDDDGSSEEVETRVVVFGDSDFASNGYFDRTRSANGDLFLNVISYLAEDTDLISVRPKDPTNRTLTLTASDERLTFWVSVVLFPLATLLFGLTVWYRRR